MQIDEELAGFIESPVMIIVGSRDRAGRPEIGRGVGASVDPSRSGFQLLVSAWQWPQTEANLKSTAVVAVTFSRPADYQTFQVRGRVRSVRDAGLAEQALAGRYMAAITEVLTGLGLDPYQCEPWQSDRELIAVGVEPVEVFIQTPGPHAGRPRRVA